MDTPLVDPRSADDIATRTASLAARLSGWRPPDPAAPPDPGSALIAVFSRFAGQVVDHLNQAPERNFITFLNLIGTQPRPPLPARAALTFALAAGVSSGALVPARTPVATGDEVGFETDAVLTVSPANLIAVLASEPGADRFSDRTAASEPFLVFTGDQPVPHDLLIGVPPTAVAGPLTVRLTTPDAPIWHDGSLAWSVWDGTSWTPLTATVRTDGGAVVVALSVTQARRSLVVAGTSAGWIRASLKQPLPVGQHGASPESAAVGAKRPQDFGPGLAPFGETPGTKWCYLSLDEGVAPGGALAHLRVTLATPGTTGRSPLRLNFSYRVGSDWPALGTSTSAGGATGTGFRDGTQAFTRDGVIDFISPATWPITSYWGRAGRWLRIELADGADYVTRPVIESVVADSEWVLPVLDAVAVASDPVPPPVPISRPGAVAANGAPLDPSRPFWPFGTEPRFGDTLEISVPPGMSTPGAPLTLSTTLVNGPGVSGSPVPVVKGSAGIAWDWFDGSTWTPLAADADAHFSTGGKVTLRPAAGVGAATRVRARLTDNGFGLPASYQERAAKDGGGYTLVPASYTPPVVTAMSWLPAPGPDAAPLALVTSDDRGEVARTVPFAPFRSVQDDSAALLLGLDRPPGDSPVTVYLAVAAPDPAEVGADRLAARDPATAPAVSWEYLAPAGWAPLPVEDRTATLSVNGTVRFLPPEDLRLANRFGITAAWIRVRWHSGWFPVPPRLDAVLTNSVTATQGTSVSAEVLGSGNGRPGQILTTARSPVLPGARLEVRGTDDAWTTWEPVRDLYASGPADQHYLLDPLTGAVTFGDGTAGGLPPVAPANVRISYRSGGGPAGNQPAGAINLLKVALPSVDAVTNQLPARGGAVAEPTADIVARGPLELRHRGRAVTAQDIEDLAQAASTEVARVKAVLPTGYDPLALWMDAAAPVPLPGHAEAAAGGAGGWGVIVVPNSPDARPAPGYGLIAEVREYLSVRCAATVTPWVAGPEWITAQVVATVVPMDAGAADTVRDRVLLAVDTFLHPLSGGPDGAGWAFGRKPHESEIYAVIKAVPGVDYVPGLTLTLVPGDSVLAQRITQVLNRPIADAAGPVALSVAQWLDRALVHSGTHTVTMRLNP